MIFDGRLQVIDYDITASPVGFSANTIKKWAESVIDWEGGLQAWRVARLLSAC
jgi:hypothetical protein